MCFCFSLSLSGLDNLGLDLLSLDLLLCLEVSSLGSNGKALTDAGSLGKAALSIVAGLSLKTLDHYVEDALHCIPLGRNDCNAISGLYILNTLLGLILIDTFLKDGAEG